MNRFVFLLFVPFFLCLPSTWVCVRACVGVSAMRICLEYERVCVCVCVLLNAHTQCQAKILSPLLLKLLPLLLLLLFQRRRRRCRRCRRRRRLCLLGRFFFYFFFFWFCSFSSICMYISILSMVLAFLCHCVYSLSPHDDFVELCWTSSSFSSSELNIFLNFFSPFNFVRFRNKINYDFRLIFTKWICFRN